MARRVTGILDDHVVRNSVPTAKRRPRVIERPAAGNGDYKPALTVYAPLIRIYRVVLGTAGYNDPAVGAYAT